MSAIFGILLGIIVLAVLFLIGGIGVLCYLLADEDCDCWRCKP